VPGGERTRKALARYLTHGRHRLNPKAPELFLNKYGRAMNRWGVQSMLDRTAEEVGFHLNAHKFRHTFATEHLRAGTPSETLRRLGGWADYSVLRLYTHLSTEDLADAQLRASPLDALARSTGSRGDHR
jgi:site-specific recombinase XerD